jgi:hypothetical protein
MTRHPSNQSLAEALEELYLELGLKRLNPSWAKAEIVLGLMVSSVGLFEGIYQLAHFDHSPNWLLLGASVVLQTLGGYLALAGHRSHLYQSQNKLFAWLSTKVSQGE